MQYNVSQPLVKSEDNTNFSLMIDDKTMKINKISGEGEGEDSISVLSTQ